MLALLLVGCAAEDLTSESPAKTSQYMVRRLGGAWEPGAAPACGEQLALPTDTPYELATLPPDGSRSLSLVRAGPGDLVITGEHDCGPEIRAEVTVENRISSEAHVRTRRGFGEAGEAPYVYSTVGVQDVIAVPYEPTNYVPTSVLIARDVNVTAEGFVLDFAHAVALAPHMVTLEGDEDIHATSYVRTAGGTSAEIGGVWVLPTASLLPGDEQTIVMTTDDLTRSVTLRVSDQPLSVRMPRPLDSAACAYGDGVPMAWAATQDAWNELTFSMIENPGTEPGPAAFLLRVLRGWPEPSFDTSSVVTIPGHERGWVTAAGPPWGPPTCRISLCERGTDRTACATASVRPI